MVWKNLARTKSIRAGLYSTTIYWKGSLPEPVAQGGVEYLYVVPTLVQLQGSHISQVYYTIAGQVRFGVRVI